MYVQGHRREGDGIGGIVTAKDLDKAKDRERQKERCDTLRLVFYPPQLCLFSPSYIRGAITVNCFGFSNCREKMKLEALRKEKDKAKREKASKSSDFKDSEDANKRKLEKSSPTDGGSKGNLDYRVVALTVRGTHLGVLILIILSIFFCEVHPGCATLD